ncbi:MAG: gamma-glutamyl-gamma-aminobutyrate hydrolase family protein [Acidimicrobiales bacterium]
MTAGQLNSSPAEDGTSRLAPYLASVERAGGEVEILRPPGGIGRPSEGPAPGGPAVLDGLDGLLLPGGGDLHPARFGRELDGRTHSLDEDLDAFELTLVVEAVARSLPLLGICRGAQVLAVALGGTLHLDLASDLPTAGDHSRGGHEAAAHQVTVQAGSLLGRLGGAGPYDTNSSHHQAVSDPGGSLRAVAWSGDGVVEAVEHVDRPFCIGVQWHPERLPDRHPSRGLFTGLVAEARLGPGRRPEGLGRGAGADMGERR